MNRCRVPRRWRGLREWLARVGGYFWLPCPCCGRDFGGFEAGRRHINETCDGGVSISWVCCRWCDTCAGAERERVELERLISLPPGHETWLISQEPTPDEWRCRSDV